MSNYLFTNFSKIFFLGIFISLNTHSLDCKDAWQDPERASKRRKNEKLLKSFQGEADKLFFQNFKEGTLTGENSFIVIRGTSAIGRILKKIDGYRILVETIDSSGELKEIEITVGIGARTDEKLFMFIPDSPFKPYREHQSHFIIDQGHPGLEMIFQAHQSPLEKIDSHSLHIPERNDKEKKLKEQGYSSAYARGISEAEEWVAVAEQLRALKPHPYKTHIDYLAGKIEAHIEHIRKKVVTPSQKEALEQLEKEAEYRMGEGNVTYDWWVRFNLYLSEVLYPEYPLSVDELRRIQELINQFPFNVLIPTTTGILGVMSINDTYPKGVLPVGLLNEKKDVDSLKMLAPRSHYLHDIGHAENFLNKIRNTYAGMAYDRLHDKLTEKKKKLPPKERKEIEFGYFIMGHESFSRLVYNSPDHIQETLLSTLRSQREEGFNFKGLMDFSENSPQTDLRIYRFTRRFSEFTAPLAKNP